MLRHRTIIGLSAILGFFSLMMSLTDTARADDGPNIGDRGTARTDFDHIVPGGQQPIIVTGSQYTACANSEVELGLLFPRPSQLGYVLDGSREFSRVTANVTADGAFKASLAMPDEFPGNWHGLITMRGACVPTTVGTRYLASLPVIVPVDSAEARRLGIASEPGIGALIVPATEIQIFPVLPPDKGSPYGKIGRFTAVDRAGGRICAEADPAEDSRLSPDGDLVLVFNPKDQACSGPGRAFSLRSEKYGLMLLEEAVFRPGWVTPIRLTWPAPDSGADVDPGAPVVGGGVVGSVEQELTESNPGGSSQSWVTVTLAVLVAAAVVILGGRRFSRR